MLVALDLLALFLLVALGFYVFVANPRNRAHQTFAAFNAFLAAWTVKDVLFWDFQVGAGHPHWWLSVSFVIGLLMQYSLAVFSWVFPENRRTPRRLAAALFAPGLVLVPSAVLGLLWRNPRLESGLLSLELTVAGYFFGAYIFSIFCVGASTLLKKFLSIRGSQEGRQLGAILWALAITAGLEASSILLLPLLGIQSLLAHSSLFVIPGVLIYAYAILNLRLFSLQSVLDQFRLFPISYKIAISIASVAIASFVALQVPIVWWSFSDGVGFEAWRRYIVFSVISALVPNLLLVLLVVRSVSRPLRRITVAAVEVAKGGYGTEVDLRRTNDEIGVLADAFNEMSRKMASDIERLRDLNDRLIRTDKLVALGTLSAGVAHEIANPLASISGLIQKTLSDGSVDERTRTDLSLALEQIGRISEVTGEMLHFARAREPERRRVDLNVVVRTAVRLASFDRSFQRLASSLELHPGPVETMADEDQLQQVVLNLLLNAKEAMPEGGRLAVRSQLQDGNVLLEVCDSGVGISEEDAPRVFDPFFTTNPDSRTGLGLAVCYGIVTSHEGEIAVEANPGGGTVVRVTLPGLAGPK